MTPPYFGRLDLGLLYPPLVAHLREALEACEVVGAHYVATEGYRTFAKQGQLYFQGRTQPGRIVTYAQPGYSAHNYGLAVDFCRMLGENEVSWEPQDYELLGEEVQKVGLVWGGKFSHPDRPHVQWPSYVDAEQLAQLKRLVRPDMELLESLRGVWGYVTSTHDTIPARKLPPDDSPQGAA